MLVILTRPPKAFLKNKVRTCAVLCFLTWPWGVAELQAHDVPLHWAAVQHTAMTLLGMQCRQQLLNRTRDSSRLGRRATLLCAHNTSGCCCMFC
jgi:hypothetical protein